MSKTNFRLNKDGQYETYGEAYDRVATRMSIRGASGLVSAFTGVASVIDAFTANPLLTKLASLVSDDLQTTRNLAMIAQSMPIPLAATAISVFLFRSTIRDFGALEEITTTINCSSNGKDGRFKALPANDDQRKPI